MAAGREPAEHALRRLLGAADGEHDVERAGRRVAVVADRELVGGLVGLRRRGRRPGRRRAGPARWSGCLQLALVRVAERSSLPPLPYQRKRTCARNERRRGQPLDALGEDEAAAARPGADFCHTPSFGALTAAKPVAGATRAKRSKRIHMRFVPATAGIDPTKVAVRCGGRRPALARGELDPQRRSLGVRAGGQREQRRA